MKSQRLPETPGFGCATSCSASSETIWSQSGPTAGRPFRIDLAGTQLMSSAICSHALCDLEPKARTRKQRHRLARDESRFDLPGPHLVERPEAGFARHREVQVEEG